MSAALSKPAGSHIRYWVIAVIFFLTTINYADRSTLSIAGSALAEDLQISSVHMGYLFSAFAWAYVIGQIPGGALLDRFGSKTVYLASITLWSLFTAAQGFVGLTSVVPAIAALFALRFCLGLTEAPSFPGNARLVTAWFPNAERGTATAIFNSAQYFSLVAFAPLMGWLAHTFGWRSVFIVMGAVGLVAAVVFALVIDTPTRHKRISKSEFEYLERGGALVQLDQPSESKQRSPLEWRTVQQLLSSRMMLGIYLSQYCITSLTYFYSTWFPIYLVKQHGLTIMEAGFASAGPALCGWVGGICGGVFSDFLLRRGKSLTWARKIPIVVGLVISGAIVACNFTK
jgi:ACS family glucarate transporter-like MFS transporter